MSWDSDNQLTSAAIMFASRANTVIAAMPRHRLGEHLKVALNTLVKMCQSASLTKSAPKVEELLYAAERQVKESLESLDILRESRLVSQEIVAELIVEGKALAVMIAVTRDAATEQV